MDEFSIKFYKDDGSVVSLNEVSSVGVTTKSDNGYVAIVVNQDEDKIEIGRHIEEEQ